MNPVTGLPNDPAVAWQPPAYPAAPQVPGQGSASAHAASAAPSTPAGAQTPSPWAQAPAAAGGPSASAPFASPASATAQDRSYATDRVPPQGWSPSFEPSFVPPAPPVDQQVPPAADAGAHADLVSIMDKTLVVLDSRILATVVLLLLDLFVIGLGSFIPFAVVMFAGYILLDRFSNVRRVITLGGIPWLAVLVAGVFVAGGVGPVAFGIDYLFMFCGFLTAVAVCGVFFISRAFYDYGYKRGEFDADRIVARHMIDRLVEHPDDWGTVDGDFLEVEGALNRVRDRQRAAEQALRDESSRKDDLVTYLAHDLKTPLASVVGYLSLLHEAPDLPVEQRVRFTGVALDKAHRLDALIEEFFDITRFDFHDIVLTRGYVDLNLMLAQVVDEFYPTLSEQDKYAEISVPEGLTVLVDGDKMARVFNNVMKNAIAYSYEGSTIRIAASRVDGAVQIRFENQGDPIPAPKLKVIFEKFYRLDAARATNRGGAGLGLAIAKEIVVAHGGQISCESTPEHTVFTITLPE